MISRRFLKNLFSVLFAIVLTTNGASAETQSDALRAQALLDLASSRLQEGGDASLAAMSRVGEFSNRELYVYVINQQGYMLASGGPSVTLVGRNLLDLKDSDGKPFIREILDRSKQTERGSIEYRWLNPQQNRVERKIGLFRAVGDKVVIVGYYMPRGTLEQAKSLLWRAAHELKQHGDQALKTFSDLNGGFIQGDLYVYVLDHNSGTMLSHGTMPQLIGRDARSLKDAEGSLFIKDLLDLAANASEGEIAYQWLNPTTRKQERKTAFYLRIKDHVLVVGAYSQ